MKTELLAALDTVLLLANETYLYFVGTFLALYGISSEFVHMETTAGVMGAKRGQWRAIKDLSRAAVDGSKWLWLQMKDSTWAVR